MENTLQVATYPGLFCVISTWFAAEQNMFLAKEDKISFKVKWNSLFVWSLSVSIFREFVLIPYL